MLHAFLWVIPRHQTAGNYPEESVQHSERGKSLKSRTFFLILHLL
jgi:hypothetical protein